MNATHRQRSVAEREARTYAAHCRSILGKNKPQMLDALHNWRARHSAALTDEQLREIVAEACGELNL